MTVYPTPAEKVEVTRWAGVARSEPGEVTRVEIRLPPAGENTASICWIDGLAFCIIPARGLRQAYLTSDGQMVDIMAVDHDGRAFNWDRREVAWYFQLRPAQFSPAEIEVRRRRDRWRQRRRKK